MSDWISGQEAAEILGVSRPTVYRSLTDPAWRADWWGEEGQGWRLKPLSRRKIYQVDRARAEALAQAGDEPAPDRETPERAHLTPPPAAERPRPTGPAAPPR